MYKILIVEDESSMRLGLMHALKSSRYQVKTAADGLEGIRLIENEDFDLVVTDLRLPGASGMEVLQAVKTLAPETGVIIITAYANVNTAVTAMKEGAYDYVSKPFDPEELFIIIGRFLKHRQLVSENIRLREEILEHRSFEEIVSVSPAMEIIFEKIAAVARTDSAVLVNGESGTGKELVANAIHNLSPRRNKPFIKINCAAIPETLIESELFGHEKGAFTGAIQQRKGKFEAAHTGTIFLDEIGDMPLSLQAKLLRVIENRSFERLGGNNTVNVDIRMIYATGKDLKKGKKDGSFRADLYYRLNVLPIILPPLRDRREDIPVLLHHFMKKSAEKLGNPDLSISAAAMKMLMNYEYPGNVRELKHGMEMAATFCKSGIIEPGCLPESMQEQAKERYPDLVISDDLPLTEKVKAYERQLIVSVLDKMDGGKLKTAKSLGISRGTLWRKLKEHGLDDGDDDMEN